MAGDHGESLEAAGNQYDPSTSTNMAQVSGDLTQAKTGTEILSPHAKVFVPLSQPIDTSEDLASKLPQGHQRLLRSYFQEPMTGQWCPYYVGTLKSFSSRTGYGFLQCAEADKDWGVDVFIHKSLVPQPWHIGQPLEFAVTMNSRAQPQATDVLWLPRLPEPRRPQVQTAKTPAIVLASNIQPTLKTEDFTTNGPNGVVISTSVGDAAAAAANGGRSAAPPGLSDLLAGRGGRVGPTQPSDERRLGVIKNFSATQGYGFLTCDATFAIYGRDVYFDKAQVCPSWQLGQCVEFSVMHNAKGNPQARNITWNPVPHFPSRQVQAPSGVSPTLSMANGSASAMLAGAGGGVGRSAAGSTSSEAPRVHTIQTMERLQELLAMLTERSKWGEAVVKAIDLQGAPPTAAGKDADREVDYVTFVLDRLGSPYSAVADLKDFVRMLLVLMVAKMLKQPFNLAQCQKLGTWFDALAENINAEQDKQVRKSFKDVVEQIRTHVGAARHENAALFQDETFASKVHTALNTLVSKVRS